jgi:hypothetical protein
MAPYASLTINTPIAYNMSTNRAEVAERQTRYVQGVVPVGVCEFKSRLRHNMVERFGSTHEMRAFQALVFVLVTNWSHLAQVLK